jgi:hypothetical protein
MIMKFLLIPIIVCIAWVTTQGQISSISKIEFTTLTRGYQKQVFILPDSVIKIVDGRQEENKITKRKLAEEEWKGLIKIVEKIPLKEIPQLPSPTSRRAFDGAKHSTITISDSNKNLWTHSFDDENPHEKLHDLMKAIKEVEGEKQHQKK